MDILDYANLAKEYRNKDSRDKKKISNMLPNIERNGGLAEIAFSANPSLHFSVKDDPNYRKYGITPNIVDNNFNEQLYNAQGFFDRAYNSIARTLVSEIGLGTAEGFSDLIGGALQLITGGNFKNVTDNSVSNYLEELKKEFDENHTIYKPDGMTILNGGFINSAWWLDNLPSVASSLTLLLPSTAATKGITTIGKLLGKATGIGKLGKRLATVEKAAANGEKTKELNKLGKFLYGEKQIAKQGVELGINAGLQRTMENYQESRQVFNDTYSASLEEFNNMSDEQFNEFVERNPDYKNLSKTDIAKDIAEKSSDRTFAMDYLNIGFDILEMAALRNLWKGFKEAKVGSTKVEQEMRNILRSASESVNGAKTATDASRKFSKIKDYLSLKGSAGKTIAAAQVSEGVEEAVNYVAQQEGMHLGNVILGKDKNNEFGDRLGSYVTDGALWDSAFWGWMGGMLFQSVAGPITNFISTGKWQTGENESRISALRDMDAKAKEFAQNAKLIHENKNIYAEKLNEETYREFNSESEKETALNKLASEYLTEIAVRQMNSGNLGYLKQYLQDENVQKMLVEQGIVDEEGTSEFFKNLGTTIDKIEEKYDNHIYNAKQSIGRLEATGKLDGLNVTPEQIQLLATENLRVETQLSNLDDMEAQTLKDIAEQESILKQAGKLDENIDYKSAIRLKALAGQIGMLQRQYEELDSKKDVVAVIAKKRIKEQIDKLNTKVEGVPETAFVNWLSSTVFKDADGSWRFDLKSEKSIKAFEEAKEFRDVDDKIVRNGFMGAFNTTLDNFESALNDFKQNDDTKYLSKLYEELPFIDIYKADASSQLAITDSQVRDRLFSYDELFKKGKKNLFNHMNDVLNKIANSTSIERAQEFLAAAYENESNIKPENFTDIAESDISDFLSTFHALKIDKDKDNIFTQFSARLELEQAKDAARTDKDTSTEPEPTPEPTSEGATPSTPVEGIYQVTHNSDGSYSLTASTNGIKNPRLYHTTSGANSFVFELPSDPDMRNQFMSDENFYTREEGIDLSKPIETTGSAPIVHIDSGKLIVDRKGTIRNIPEGTTPAPTTTPTGSTPAPVIPSTGGVNSALYDSEGQPIYDIAQSFFNVEAVKVFNDASNPITLDNAEEKKQDLLARAKTEIENRGYSIEDYREELAEFEEMFDYVVEQKLGSAPVTRESSVAECYIFNDTPTIDTLNSFTNAYTNLINKFIEDTQSVFVVNSEGKQIRYINTEALARYIDESNVCNRNMLPIIYNGLVKFLQMKEFEDTYVVTDGIKSLEELVNDLNKRVDDRIEELATESIIRCNISELENKDNKAARKAFDSLELDDPLTAKVVNGESGRNVLIQHNGVTVGRLTVPSVAVINGLTHYQLPVQGFEYDLFDDNGIIYCNLRDVFSALFHDNRYVDAKTILYDFTYRVPKLKGKAKEDVIAKCIDDFKNTSYWQLLQNKLTKDGINNPILPLNHLKSLLKYNQSLNITSVNPTSVQQTIIDVSLTKWFNKLYNSYQYTVALADNPDDIEVSVADINEGELNITDTPNYLRTAKGNPRIANLNSNIDETDDSKPVHRIAAVAASGATLVASGQPAIPHSPFKVGSTFVTIPTRNGNVSYVQAFPLTLSEIANATPEFRELIKAVRSELDKIFDLRFGNDSSYTFDRFYDALNKIFNSDGLFAPVNVKKQENTIYLNLQDGSNRIIAFYRNNKSDNGLITQSRNLTINKVTYTRDKAKEEMNKILDSIFSNCRINISHKLIQADSNRHEARNYGMLQVRDGKFIVEIGDFRKEYNSYNEFILDNNLVKVKTAVNQKTGTNFKTRSESNTINRTLQLRLVNKKAKANVTSRAPRYSIVKEEDVLKDKLNDNSITNKGEALVENRIPKKMLNALHNLELLPKNVIFVDNTGTYDIPEDEVKKLINGEINASTLVESGKVYIAQSLLSHLARNSGRDNWRATRILIHEQLHIKLHNGNTDVINQIKDVYNEFKEFINNTDTSSFTEAQKKSFDHLKEYLFEDRPTDEALEEFLVESLTNKELIDALNLIPAKEYTIDESKHTEETLFEKIFNLLNEVFNWFNDKDIQQGNLYKKELDTLAGIVVSTTGNSSTTSNVSSTTSTNTPAESTSTRKYNHTRRGRTRRSSVNEYNDNSLQIKCNSVSDFMGTLDAQNKPIFRQNIASAEFEYSCR